MNILNKQCKAMAPTPNSYPVSKREKFSWAESCAPGVFLMVRKQDLNIDGSYQREEVSKDKVLEIARHWDWKLFGTLSVIRRIDGTLWVYDGGHRCRASFFRDDITSLPCMIFTAEDEKTEAKAFVGANTMKSAVSAYHKHRASVKTGEPIAVAAQSILEKHGYHASQSVKRKYEFAAVSMLHSHVKEDRLLAEKVFSVAASIAQNGESISGEVIDALFRCQKKLEGRVDILSNSYLEKLRRETLPGIEAAIRREKHIAGQGGSLIRAKALLDLINKGKSRRITFL